MVVDSSTELSSLKVTELRAALKKRGLKPDGKKIDLVNRLKAWFEEQESAEEAEKPKLGTEIVSDDVEKADVVEKPSEPEEPKPMEVETDSRVVEKGEEVAVDTSNKSVSQEGIEESSGEKRKRIEITRDLDGSPGPKRARRDWGESRVPDESVPVSTDSLREIVKAKESERDASDVQEGPRANSDEGKADGAPPATTESTSRTLQVENFVRPFTILEAEEFVGRHEKVRAFQLNELRSVATVEYETVEAALAAQKSIDGVQWPPGHGKKLRAVFVGDRQESAKEEKEEDASATLSRLFQVTKTDPPLYWARR